MKYLQINRRPVEPHAPSEKRNSESAIDDAPAKEMSGSDVRRLYLVMHAHEFEPRLVPELRGHSNASVETEAPPWRPRRSEIGAVLRARSNVVVSVYQDPRTFDEAQKEFAVIRSPHSLAVSPRALLTRGTFRASKQAELAVAEGRRHSSGRCRST